MNDTKVIYETLLRHIREQQYPDLKNLSRAYGCSTSIVKKYLNQMIKLNMIEQQGEYYNEC